MKSLLIRNINIINWDRERKNVDILIERGIIRVIGRNINKKGVPVIDGKGLYAFPGFIDVHVHLREPGYEDKETIETGLKAASKGGFVCVFPMPNTNPCADRGSVIKYIKEKAGSIGVCEVYPVGAITRGRQGRELAELGEMYLEGVKGYSDDGNYLENSLLMQTALYYSKDFGIPIIQHAELEDLSEGGVANESPFTLSLGLKGRPREAEIIAIFRDIMLLKKTKGKLHIAHVSCKESVELIKRAKEEGLNITSEVTPHHLVLTEQEIKNYNTNAKVFPPLRLEEDREALFEGLKEGIIDVIATDHAPHRLQDKEVEFDYASPGISGLETAFSIITTFFYHKGKLSLKDISRVMSYNPARIFNIEKMGEIKEGFYGNVVIVDINREWVCDPLNFISKGKNTPFKGYKLKGEVIYTIYKGKITYNGGKKI